jgi:hypothetical protein
MKQHKPLAGAGHESCHGVLINIWSPDIHECSLFGGGE